MILNNIKYTIGGKDILNDISFTINNGDKIGLIGKNGSGKTTLLKIINGKIKDFSGKISKNEIVYLLEQEIPIKYNEYSIIQYLKCINMIDKYEEILEESEIKDISKYTETLEKYLALDGYNFKENVLKYMNKLKLNKGIDTKIKELSGGEKIKVLLVNLHIAEFDILLLDEPTNNIDLETLKYLEEFLKNIKKTLIIVSHDEEFLENIVNKVIELENGKIEEFNCKYRDYLNIKEISYNREMKEYEKAIEEKNNLKQQLQKSKVWANSGNSKKSFKDNDKIANNFAKEKTNNTNISKINKKLDKMIIPKFEYNKGIDYFFNFDDVKGNKDIVFNSVICGYDDFRTKEITVNIPFGSRVNIVGRNGSGKTTLIKTILKQISPIQGSIDIGSACKFGYISQETLLNIDKTNNISIYKYLTKDILKNNTKVDDTLIFTILKKFNISYLDKDKKYNDLSAGQRTRVNLAKFALNNTNILILDEPTNHLDIQAITIIYDLIKSYKGTIISISHNRKYNKVLSADIIIDLDK